MLPNDANGYLPLVSRCGVAAAAAVHKLLRRRSFTTDLPEGAYIRTAVRCCCLLSGACDALSYHIVCTYISHFVFYRHNLPRAINRERRRTALHCTEYHTEFVPQLTGLSGIGATFAARHVIPVNSVVFLVSNQIKSTRTVLSTASDSTLTPVPK